jgi:hypothetical protein
MKYRIESRKKIVQYNTPVCEYVNQKWKHNGK